MESLSHGVWPPDSDGRFMCPHTVRALLREMLVVCCVRVVAIIRHHWCGCNALAHCCHCFVLLAVVAFYKVVQSSGWGGISCGFRLQFRFWHSEGVFEVNRRMHNQHVTHYV